MNAALAPALPLPNRRQLQPFEQLLALLRGKEVGQPANWSEVARLAGWHSVAPLLAAVTPSRSDVPLETRAFLEGVARNTAHQNLLLTAELLKIAAAFEGAHISVLPYKGPALAVMAYSNLAARQFGDLDFLLRAEDLPAARALLEELGFVPWRAFSDLSPAEERAYLRTGYHFQYCRPDGSIPVELHWAVAPRSFCVHVPIETLLRRSTRVQIGSSEILSPRAEDLAVLLCVHGAKHMWESLGLIADLAMLLRATPQLNYEDVMTFATQINGRRMVLLGLSLAGEIFDVRLPQIVELAAKQDPTVARLVHKVIAGLPNCRRADEYRLKAHRFYFAIRERKRDKVRAAMRLLFDPSLNDARLASNTGGLKSAALLRPVRVLGKVAQHSFRAAVRRS